MDFSSFPMWLGRITRRGMSIDKKHKRCEDSSWPVQCSEVRGEEAGQEENQDSGALKGGVKKEEMIGYVKCCSNVKMRSEN